MAETMNNAGRGGDDVLNGGKGSIGIGMVKGEKKHAVLPTENPQDHLCSTWNTGSPFESI